MVQGSLFGSPATKPNFAFFDGGDVLSFINPLKEFY